MNKFEFIEMMNDLKKKYKSVKACAEDMIDEHLIGVNEGNCDLNQDYIDYLEECTKWADIEEAYHRFII